MHDSLDITQQGGEPIDTRVLANPTTSPSEATHKECCSCLVIKPYGQFRRDSSYREGVRDQCWVCETSPRLSTHEHTLRLKEANYSSHGVRKQRWAHQLDYMDDDPRAIHWMHHSEFLYRLRQLRPDLFITDGRFVGDLAVYRVFGRPQADGLTFQYLWYVPTGWMPEYSLYEFDPIRDIPIRERQRGWRTPLLRLIKSGLASEERCREIFGDPVGPASAVWRRNLFIYRNGHE